MRTLIAIVLLAACTSSDKHGPDLRFPGEFEPQQAVWLAWEGDSAFHAASLAMVRGLLPHVKLKMAVATDSLLHACKRDLWGARIDTAAIEFHVLPGVEMWMRDCGATYVIKDGALHAVDFTWDNYALRDWLVELFEGDTLRADTVAAMSSSEPRGFMDSLSAMAEGTPVIRSWFRIEGGAIESNGKGTLILNEPLTLQRNPGVTKDSIAHELKRVLRITHIIWLPHGVAEDPHMWETIAPGYFGIGAGGHTDQYVRFADAHTVLLAWMPEAEKDSNPVNKINYERMSANYNVLAKSMDQDGKPLRVVKVPMPDLCTMRTVMREPRQWDDSYSVPVSAFPKRDGWAAGDSAWRVAAASYMNYLVTNDAVLLPSFAGAGSSEEKEAEVQRIFTEVFPGRTIIPLECMPLNWDGGGIHCATQQVPKVTP